ncbi:transcriptional regulator, LysR family [Noviherbaspirillum humi]|uniref:Transcriptional regulator, LysR family n=1 Tax=Noviherbaspirillum humi TaxID=1688639 RepID=A0A239M2R2_9BURK|nr:LysR family transcriptional regulator [Noviherbaspirillum humi]SNT36408.1 transcriptional regulator, LysR family [Noviherbaspirillum humi]
MTFDQRQLSAFLAIVEHGSLGRAADVLHLTQPALSRTVKRLESQVGAPLFERNSKGMLLTAVGEALLPHATLMERVAEQAHEEIDAVRGLAKGTIRVGGIASVVGLLLPLAIQRVLTRWPNLKVQIIEGVWDRLADALVKHEIDLALGVAADESEEIVPIADCYWEDNSYVVASAGHPLQRKRQVSLADTIDQRWASTPKGTAPYQHLHEVFRSKGLGKPNIVVETRSIITLKSLVSHAGFLCWMAGPMFEDERRVGLMSALAIPGLDAHRRLTVFRRRDGIMPTPAVRLLDELRQLALHNRRADQNPAD